ncbi:MAG TPA: hypothetical protein VK387_09615 [Thermoleophilaceae bacterium]|nr:hypothetical protein [Thermoleophilaceae bacterium]
MSDRLKTAGVIAAAIAALALGGAALAGAERGQSPGGERGDSPAASEERGERGERDDDRGRDDDAGEASTAVSGPAADRARAAALAASGPGTVTEIEAADEGGRGYEVEVERRDGSFVEVELDPGFRVVSKEADDD